MLFKLGMLVQVVLLLGEVYFIMKRNNTSKLFLGLGLSGHCGWLVLSLIVCNNAIIFNAPSLMPTTASFLHGWIAVNLIGLSFLLVLIFSNKDSCVLQ